MPKSENPATSGQTAAQRLVRSLGAVVFLLAVFAMPVAQALWAAFAGDARDQYRTFGYVPAPEPSLGSFLEGSYMPKLERHLQESSPLVWEVRGCYNEWRFRLGLLQTEKVHIGRDGWMFYRQGMAPDAAVVDGRHERRIAVFASIKAAVKQLGAELFVVVLPDKDRVYPEFAYPEGQVPRLKAGLYPLLMQELQAAGIAHLDANAALARAKASAPEDLLYCQRDSHWTPLGARVVAESLAKSLEEGSFAGLLGPRRPDLALAAPEVVDLLPDLVGLCGMRYVMLPVPSLSARFPFPASALTRTLVESKRYYRIALAGREAGEVAAAELEELRSRSPIALAGTSFSGENGAAAFAWALGRVIDDRVIMVGAGSIAPMQAVLGRMVARPGRVRLVVWEMVERGVLEGDWAGL